MAALPRVVDALSHGVVEWDRAARFDVQHGPDAKITNLRAVLRTPGRDWTQHDIASAVTRLFIGGSAAVRVSGEHAVIVGDTAVVTLVPPGHHVYAYLLTAHRIQVEVEFPAEPPNAVDVGCSLEYDGDDRHDVHAAGVAHLGADDYGPVLPGFNGEWPSHCELFETVIPKPDGTTRTTRYQYGLFTLLEAEP